jgi:hypothetical protein
MTAACSWPWPTITILTCALVTVRACAHQGVAARVRAVASAAWSVLTGLVVFAVAAGLAAPWLAAAVPPAPVMAAVPGLLTGLHAAVLWWGPKSTPARTGTRRVLARAAPWPLGAAVTISVCLAASCALGAHAWHTATGPQCHPLPGPATGSTTATPALALWSGR